jgi:hypothetical protein
MDACGWNETMLAKRSGISRTIVSRHLTGQRAIGRQHLAAYLRAVNCGARTQLIEAWLTDLGLHIQDLDLHMPQIINKKRLWGLLWAPWLHWLDWSALF